MENLPTTITSDPLSLPDWEHLGQMNGHISFMMTIKDFLPREKSSITIDFHWQCSEMKLHLLVDSNYNLNLLSFIVLEYLYDNLAIRRLDYL